MTDPLFEIRPTDTLFDDSPDAGDALCSRCGKIIPERCLPIRAWPEEADGSVRFEYRFHPTCVGFDSDLEDEDEDPWSAEYAAQEAEMREELE